MADDKLHYTQCGLDNVFLLNGFAIEHGTRGQVVRVNDQQGLHAVIGEALIRQRSGLSGKEVRFLRHEMGLSQAVLARLLGEDEQSVARREKRAQGTKRVGAQERMIRYLYEQFIGGDEELSSFLKTLAEQDERAREDWEFRNAGGWNRAA